MRKPSLGILKFHIIDHRQSFLIFWSIFTLTIIAGLSIGFLFENVQLFYAISFPVYIYAGFAGFLTLKQSFPSIISLGITRKDFFFYTTLAFLIVSAIMVLTLNMLLTLLTAIKNWLSIDGIAFFHTAMIGDVSNHWGMRLLIDFSLTFFVMAFFFFIASLYFRYGLVVVGLFAAALLTFFLVFGTTDYFTSFLSHLASSQAPFYYLLFIVAGFIFSSLCWVVMKRSSVEQKIA